MSYKTQDAPKHTGLGGQVSVLASDLVINGVVASEGTVELHGQIDGEVAAGILVIGEDGKLTGKVQAGQVELRGRLEGNAVCAAISLRTAAVLVADVQSDKVIIETGAQVEGRFSRPKSNASIANPIPPAAPPAPEADPAL